jgi:type IV pilus assembly protein PilQ
MLHFVSFSRRNGSRLFYFSVFIITGLLLCSTSASGADEPAPTEKNIISKVTAQENGNNLVLQIQGSTAPTYTIYELFKPSRIVVDVADAEVKDPDSLTLPSNINIGLATKYINDVTPSLTRFEFTLPQSYSFNTSQKETDIVIVIEGFADNKQAGVQEEATASATASTEDRSRQKQSIESQLPTVDPLKPSGAIGDTISVAAMQDNFSFSGYTKERITVDFYKIDLHNVFRLLRDVSGVNIVVDESVAGSLTLALNDVPWDFAMDIILNLKDLAKEERFNTIVIYPKSKSFNWPERTEDNLSFEADIEVVEQESLIIQQQQSLPQAEVDAKKLIAKGRKAEKRGDLETAVQLYEEALKKWPKNSRLANKISAIYLVQLRQNAKAAYFADKALAADNKNSSAALNAAIAHANMQEYSQAQQYFDQSVSTGKPSREALVSYAAFSEQQTRYDAAVKLLQKYDELYGQDLNSMVARARVLDKQGEHELATETYRAILLAGFRVPPDLKKFITGRMSLSQSM